MPSIKTCPACNYTRQPTDNAPDWECPKCQKAYNKITQSEHPHESVVRTQCSADYIQVSISGENKLDSCSQIHFDGSRPVDPIAMKTKWTPAITNVFRELPREIVRSSADRVELSSIKTARVSALPFIVIGIVFAIGIIHSTKYIPIGEKVFAVGSAFIIIALGCIVPYLRNKPVVFDKSRGSFWKGGNARNESPDMDSVQDFTSLEDIHALQLIYWQTYNPASKAGKNLIRLVELNLVLKNNRRVNVSLYGAARVISISFTPNSLEKKSREIAAALGKFLGKPVWDAIDSTKSYWRS